MGNLLVGAAKECITPPPELFPLGANAGAGVNRKFKASSNARGVESPDDVIMGLFTRAVLIDNGQTWFLFLNLDCGPAPDYLMKKSIEEKYGIPIDHIIGVWTHNHSAKIKWSHDPDVSPAYEYSRTVYNGVFAAIDKAIKNRKPAKYGFGEGKSYFNVCRDRQYEDGHWMEGPNLAGPSDKTLAVMKFEDLEGNLIAAVLNYGCHANCGMGRDADGKAKISPGFPGFTSDYIEKRYGNNAVCLWTSGAAGDQDPLTHEGFIRHYETDGYNEPIAPPPGYGFLMQKWLGQEHAIDAIQTLKSITKMKDHMNIVGTSSVLEMLGQRPPAGANVREDWAITQNAVRTRYPELLINDRCPPKETRCTMVQEGISRMQMQVALLGDVAWIGASGELYCEIGMKLKESSPFRKTVVVTHTHGDAMCNGGYIISDNAAAYDVFTRWSTETYPGGNDEKIVNKALEMFDEVLNEA